jgi:uncharacterized protein (DUF608 family)
MMSRKNGKIEKCIVWCVIINFVLLITNACFAKNDSDRLFPTGLPEKQWVSFSSKGFSVPVTGVIYNDKFMPVSGCPVGGLDTGCLDIDASGLYGYCTIFNHLFPRGLANVPILGMNINGQTWVLTSGKAKKYAPKTGKAETWPPMDFGAYYYDVGLEGVKLADSIEYWGHYPITDMEFETTAPVQASLRAWSPFMPGDTETSMLPGAVFEICLKNISKTAQKGVLVFNFPGFEPPSSLEINTEPSDNYPKGINPKVLPPVQHALRPWASSFIVNPLDIPTGPFIRKELNGNVKGIYVARPQKGVSWEMSYALGVIGSDSVRYGGSINNNGKAWAQIDKKLPDIGTEDSGSSVAVDFDLKGNKSSIVRFVLTWHAPYWKSGGLPNLGGNTYKHMYSKYYPDPEETAKILAKQHKELLKRVISWQEVVYTDTEIPGWLADQLINALYLITEDGVWAQKSPPIGNWCKKEDGLFGLNECPRGCAQIECIGCSFYGNQPFAYFFPKCALSTLRAYKAYQFQDGQMPWVFGGYTTSTPPYELVIPARGYQVALNAAAYVIMVNRYWRITGKDTEVLREFWESLKKATDFTFSCRPNYGMSQIVAMPAPGTDIGGPGSDTEWFEAPEPGWKGYVTHAGGVRMAQAMILREMAKALGDKEYEKKCDQWLTAGSQALEEKLWTGKYYLNFNEPETGQKSDLVFGYQLDGEFIADWEGVPGVFPKERVDTVLETLKRINDPISESGVVNYANPDGSPAKVGGYGTYSYFIPELQMLSMNYMYEGQKDFGIELARKCMYNAACKWGYTWDAPNFVRGDKDTGERHFGADYYQNMMIWSMPAALKGQDLTGPSKPGGLVYKIIQAATKK